MTQDNLSKQNSKFKKFDKSICCANEIMKLQKSHFERTGLGFMKTGSISSVKEQGEKGQENDKIAAMTHGTDGTKNLVPPVEPIGSVEAAAEENISVTNRNEFVKVTKKSNTSSTETKLKPAIKIGVGLAKNEYRTRTTQPIPKTPISKCPIPKSNYNTQPYFQHSWGQNIPRNHQVPNYMSWNPYPSFPYMNQGNGMINQNGPMRYWGPNVSVLVIKYVCLKVCLEPDQWIKDRGCSRHMMRGNCTRLYLSRDLENLTTPTRQCT